jgi:flagellar basal body-associated protein FliL
MRKTTDGKGFAGAVVITILVAGFMFLLTGAMLAGYFGSSRQSPARFG